MDTLVIFLVISFIILLFIAVMFIVSRVSKRSASKTKSRGAILAAGLKRLSQDPHDVDALRVVGDIYIQDKDWEKAYSVFLHLVERSESLPPTQKLDVHVKYGLVSLKSNRIEEAKNAFLIARTFDQNDFDVNYNLGYIHYLEKEYDKSIPLLRKAIILREDSIQAKKYLGFSYLKDKKYHDALPFLKTVFEISPEDKESLFAIGQCFFELSMNDNALGVLSKLKLDQTYGPESCLYAGMIHLKASQYEKAIEYFDIGLKHEQIQSDLKNEIKYRYAQCCIKQQDISRALSLLKEIQMVNPGYKDTMSLISKYHELNQNKALKTYLMAGQSEFVGLCRKIVAKFYPNARVKIVDIVVLTTHTDVVASVDADRFTDTAIFRFFRSQGSVGELLLRDFHGRIKELKAGSGICFSAGVFTEEAIKFSEGRPIEIYDKERLNKILSTIE